MKRFALHPGITYAPLWTIRPRISAEWRRGMSSVSIDGQRVVEGALWPNFEDEQRVELGIERNGIARTQTLFAVPLEPFADVVYERLDERTGYVRIRSFSQDGMEDEALDAIRDCLEKGTAIVDLRHNPGGAP